MQKKRAPLVLAAIIITGVGGSMAGFHHLASHETQRKEFESYDSRDGKKEAEADLANDTPKWKVTGLRGGIDESREQNRERMRRLFGIEEDWFMGCLVSEGIVRYQNSYNARIRAHFAVLYGEELVGDVIGAPPEDSTEAEG